MNTKKKQRNRAGKQISVSPEAYEVIAKDAFNSKPRRTIREHMNIINGISPEK